MRDSDQCRFQEDMECCMSLSSLWSLIVSSDRLLPVTHVLLLLSQEEEEEEEEQGGRSLGSSKSFEKKNYDTFFFVYFKPFNKRVQEVELFLCDSTTASAVRVIFIFFSHLLFISSLRSGGGFLCRNTVSKCESVTTIDIDVVRSPVSSVSCIFPWEELQFHTPLCIIMGILCRVTLETLHRA